MFIDRIDLIQVQNPLVHPFETSFYRFENRDSLIVKLYSQGITGYGECKAFGAPLYNPEDNGTCRHIIGNFLVPAILHKDVEGPETFIESTRFIRGNNLAVAAVENALWDLKRQTSGQSLKTLLGGVYDEIKVGISLGIEADISVLLDRIQAGLDKGYHRTKVKIKPGWDLEVLQAIRRRFPDIVLTVDANSAYRLEDADLFKAMDEYDLEYIEQPLAEDDLVDHAALQKQIKAPICLDESIESVEDARKAIELGSCRIINLKSSRCRGICDSIKIHDLCQDRGIPVWCGGMLELGIGRAQNISLASLPNFSLAHDIAASSRYFPRDLTDPTVELTPAATLLVPDEGNGITYHVDEKALQDMTVAYEVFR